MAMNPRLLKPTASGFNPRSISGLALWLDASSTDSLYTTDAGPVTAVSSPLDIAGCLCWYDAADASSITKDGSNLVSQWNDKSGNSRHATTSGSLRPTSGGSQNGRTVMQFTGTQAMTITGNFLQSDNVTMFAVAMKNADHYGGIITSAPTNPEDSPVLTFYLTTIAWLNRRQLVQQATGNGVYRIVSGQSVGTAQQGFFDGVRGTDTVASVATNTTGTITKIGALRTSSTADLNGNIAEIVCYSGNLTTANRASVEAYLAAKWGISGVHRPVTQELTAVGSPLELADCALWLDADQSVTPSLFDATVGGSAVTAENGTVARWQDKSGNNRHATQAESARRPLFKNSSYNGRPCLNGSGDRFMVCEDANINAASLTLFAVYRMSEWQPTDNSINPNIYHTDIPASGYASVGLRSEQGGGAMNVRIGDADSSAYYTLAGITSTHQNQTAIQATRLNGSTGAIVSRVSGTQAASATVAGTNIPASFGSRVAVMTGFQLIDTGRRWRGDLAEFIIFRRDLSDTDMQRVEKYLAAKWGIANVPDPTPPVGYWADKSRNGRHAVQATASLRPAIGTLGAKKALSFAGNAIATQSYAAKATSTYVYVGRHDETADTFFQTGPTNGFHSHLVEATSKFRRNEAAAKGIVLGTNVGVGVDSLWCVDFSNDAISVRHNGVTYGTTSVASEAAISDSSRATTLGRLAAAETYAQLNGRIAEFMVYAGRNLTASERGRLERHLAAKWGITLAPTVANADAQDWINRVYQNGGTVSTATAGAVNTFCDSIDAASIRDRFYRLGIFAGSNLNAALVPLYLTPDKTLTNLFQFGTDMTNTAWLAGGNGSVTRTATTEAGPLGYGYATKFTTPSAPFDVRQMYQQPPPTGQQATVSAWMKTSTGTRQIQWLAGNAYSDTVTVTSTWQRFTKTFTLPTATDARTGFSTVSELSDAAGFIYVWGMQCEFGPTATSYNQPRYGNTTDTNNAFVGVGTDYAETGATGGLTGNGSTKSLRHGVLMTSLPNINSVHLSAYQVAAGNGLSSLSVYWQHSTDSSQSRLWEIIGAIGYLGNTNSFSAPAGSRPALLTLSRESQNVAYGYLGSSQGTLHSTSGQSVVAAETVVFARNLLTGSPPVAGFVPVLHSSATLGGYSLGQGMTAAQAAAYNTAMQAFQSAMGRT